MKWACILRETEILSGEVKLFCFHSEKASTLKGKTLLPGDSLGRFFDSFNLQGRQL